MKSVFLILVVGLANLVFGQELPLQVQLTEKQAYQLYEHLTVPVQVENGGRSLVKRSDTVECSKTSFYPGDFEYSCSINLAVDETGTLVP